MDQRAPGPRPQGPRPITVRMVQQAEQYLARMRFNVDPQRMVFPYALGGPRPHVPRIPQPQAPGPRMPNPETDLDSQTRRQG